MIYYLNGLEALGIGGVKVAIGYPILAPDFPRSREYLRFYQRVAQELKKRNMVMLVGTGILFSDPAFNNLSVDYSGLTLDRYREVKRQMVETIIEEIHPDYLTIDNEPSTLAAVTGLKITPSEFTRTVQYILKGLDRRGVRIGAGAGSWDKPNFVRSLARDTSLDYIDVHIYPINRDFFDRALSFADMAISYNKKFVIGEAWLYKVSDSELAKTRVMVSQPEIFGRDVFNFWEPVDREFLEVISKLAHYKQCEFVSPFWSRYFFSYIDYDRDNKDLTYGQLADMVDREASRNIMAGKYSRTGTTYRELAAAGKR